MSVVDEFVANRVLHVRNQLAGGAHGRYKDNCAVKAEGTRLWSLLSDTEKREAERRYFEETTPILRNAPR